MSELPVIKPEWLAGITMTQAQKDVWLAALRSGDYTQGRKRLYSSPTSYETAFPERFCCLGVACVSALGMTIHEFRGAYNMDDLGSNFVGKLRWQNAHTIYECPGSVQAVLVYLNDTLGYTFAQIADFIESNIPACDAAVKS
jgi:hypothetical protein